MDRSGVAAGASWGNAGWVAPALTIRLNQPAVLGYGLRSLTSPTAPLHIPLTADAGLWTFLARFAVNCRRSSWTRAVRANLPLNEECIEAFDVLTVNGVDVSTTDGPITAVFQSTRQAQHLLDGLGRLEDAGQSLFVTGLFGEALREQANAAAIKCPAARRCR